MLNAGSQPSIPESPPSQAKRSTLLGTFAFRNFRLLWFGLLISNIGTWMQITALGYLVVNTAGNESEASLRLGLIGLSQALPALVLSPLAGVVADTFGRKQILLVTNSIVTLLAVALSVLVTKNMTSFPLLVGLAVISSAARTFDSPARQSWVPLLVDRAHLGNAIGLNSLAFNAPSAIAPSIAGFLIASVSLAGSFYANVFCTIAVLIALLFMDAPTVVAHRSTDFVHAFKDGVAFLAKHPVLRWIMLGLICNALLVRPYLQLLPAYAVHAMRMGPSELGILLGASGVGAIFGALTTALIGNVERRAKLWTLAGVFVGICLAGLGISTLLPLACVALVGAGFFTLIFVGSSNILIQTLAPDEMRGRAISAFSMVILGIVPLGTLTLGKLSNHIGLRTSFIACGLLATVITAVIWATHRPLREA